MVEHPLVIGRSTIIFYLRATPPDAQPLTVTVTAFEVPFSYG
jgi:hypothetical protein